MPDKSLHFAKPLFLFVSFIAFLLLAIGVLNFLSEQRRERIYQRYNDETQSYIAKNQTALLSILASASAQFKNCAASTYDYYHNCYQDEGLKERIAKELSHDLQDWSSTAFFFKTDTDPNYAYVRLSGEVGSGSYGGEKMSQVSDLMSGKVERLTWDDYTYLFQNKEVIIPVKDKSKKVVGAVVRGVIEQKSF